MGYNRDLKRNSEDALSIHSGSSNDRFTNSEKKKRYSSDISTNRIILRDKSGTMVRVRNEDIIDTSNPLLVFGLKQAPESSRPYSKMKKKNMWLRNRRRRRTSGASSFRSEESDLNSDGDSYGSDSTSDSETMSVEDEDSMDAQSIVDIDIAIQKQKHVNVFVENFVVIPAQEYTDICTEDSDVAPAQEYADISIEDCIVVPAKDSVVVPAEKFVDIPVKECVAVSAEKFIDVPVEECVAIPVQEVINVSVKDSVVVPAQEFVDIPVEECVAVPVQELIDVSTEDSVVAPAQKFVDIPAGECDVAPTQKFVDIPVEECAVAPAQEFVDVSAEDSVVAPAQEFVDVPVENCDVVAAQEFVDVPVEDCDVVTAQKIFDIPVEDCVVVPAKKYGDAFVEDCVAVPTQEYVDVSSGDYTDVSDEESFKDISDEEVHTDDESDEDDYLDINNENIVTSTTSTKCVINSLGTPTKRKTKRRFFKYSLVHLNETPSHQFGLSYLSGVSMNLGDFIDDRMQKCVYSSIRSKAIKHDCSFRCAQEPFKLNQDIKTINSYLIPFYHGFQRFNLLVEQEKRIIYKTPCNKVLTNLNEVEECLKILAIEKLNVGNFTFSPELEFAQFNAQVFCYIPDITDGKENRMIPYYNCSDNVQLPRMKVTYITSSIYDDSVMNSVPFYLSKSYSSRHICNCEASGCLTNNCLCFDRFKGQRNDESLREEREYKDLLDSDNQEFINYFETDDTKTYAYAHKMLPFVEDEGILECGNLCSCEQHCPTRVVGNGVQVKIAIFRIVGKGFGVKAMQFIPRGTFVGTYAGVWYETSKIPKHLENSSYSLVVPIPERIEFQQTMSSNQPMKSFTLNNEDTGNFGRYFNHSCVPNIYVQKVYIASDDPRFPTLAFFTSRDVHFGEELCWDYNSEAMLSKFHCLCGYAQCKGLPIGYPLAEVPIESVFSVFDEFDDNYEGGELNTMEKIHLSRLLYEFVAILNDEVTKNYTDFQLPPLSEILTEAIETYSTFLKNFNLEEEVNREKLQRILSNPVNLNYCLKLVRKEFTTLHTETLFERSEQNSVFKNFFSDLNNETELLDFDPDSPDDNVLEVAYPEWYRLILKTPEDEEIFQIRLRLQEILLPLVCRMFYAYHLIGPDLQVNVYRLVRHIRAYQKKFKLGHLKMNDKELYELLNNPYLVYRGLKIIEKEIPNSVDNYVELFDPDDSELVNLAIIFFVSQEEVFELDEVDKL